MKNIILLSTESDFKNSLSQKYRPYYERLITLWIKKDIQIIRSSIYQYNINTNTFLIGETFNGDKWIDLKNIAISKVWYKSNTVNYLTRIIEKNNPFINNTEFVELVNDKYITSLHSPEYSPKTLLLNDQGIKDFIETDKNNFIIKPNWWSWGKGVEKVSVNELRKLNSDDYVNYIIQETLDSSDWIPWVIEWIHDIRFVMFWLETMSHILIRTPPKEDFRCNITAWWSTQYIPITSLPEELVLLISTILKKINSEFWNIFWSIDLTKADWKYYLIEYNSSPGIRSFSFKENLENEYYHKIVEFLSI